MNLSIYGSTGSIGTQTLDIVRNNKEKYKVYALTAGNNDELLIKQAKEFMPKVVGIHNEQKYENIRKNLPKEIEVLCGNDVSTQIAKTKVNMAVCAIVGMAGLDSFIHSLKNADRVGLANKESLVCGGELIKNNSTPILPIDSEHSAIFQCINGNQKKEIQKLIITASGGPFRAMPVEQFSSITPQMALKHPNWSMGSKITIDSATLMNKGLEVIEAVRLFDVSLDQIEVVVHKQSIIHSMVEFIDGSVMAQMGNADMRIPIQYAMTYPKREKSEIVNRLDLTKIGTLDFEKPDTNKFRCLSLAFEALKMGGLALTALNASNEAAVGLFLQEKISFVDISKIVEYALNNYVKDELTLENIHSLHESMLKMVIMDYKRITSLL